MSTMIKASFVLLLLLAGCGSLPKPASAYDQSCTTSSDCIVEAAQCGGCCAKVAINKDAKAAYERDRSQLSCPSQPCTALCTNPSAQCQNGTCTLN